MRAILAVLAALGSSLSWGVGQAIGKRALNGMSVPTYNLIRESVGAAVAAILLAGGSGFLRITALPASTLALAIIGSVLGYVVWLLLLFVTLQKYSLSGVIPYFHLGPVFVIGINFVLGIEPLTVAVVVGTVVILVGIFFVAQGARATLGALVFGICASAGNGAWLVINRRCLETMSSSELFFVQSTFSCAVFVALGARSLGPVRRYYLGQALISGVLCRAIGVGLMFSALAVLPAVVVAPLLRLTLVSASLSGVFLLGEKWSRRTVFGTALVLAGSATLAVLGIP